MYGMLGISTCLATGVFTAGPPTYDLGPYTVDGGGETLAGPTYSLAGTVGQTDAGTTIIGPSYAVAGGFWTGGGACVCLPDLAPPVGVLDFTDVLAFLVAFSSKDSSVDFAEPFGVFDFTDVIVFLSEFGAGCQ